VPEGVQEPDLGGPLFFLSYARMNPIRGVPIAQPDPNLKVQQLFAELSVHVNNLVYRAPGSEDPGYMDMTMQGSEPWQRVLLDAVCTCQVFVALLSPAYLNSEWCAMEWNAFAARPVHRRNGMASNYMTSIIPVVWTPNTYDVMPDSIQGVQMFTPVRLPNPALAQAYQDEGLRGLLALGVEGTEGIILRLAQRIVHLWWTNSVERNSVTDIASLPRAFK
jgi:hypothetical protein